MEKLYLKFSKKLDKNLEKLNEARYFIQGHFGNINWIDVDPGFKKALTGSSDKTVKLWDLRTGYIIANFLGHHKEVLMACFYSKKLAVSCAGEKGFRVWDLRTKLCLKSVEFEEDILKIAVINKKELIATYTATFNIFFWSFPDCDVLFYIHSNKINSIANNSELLISASAHGTIYIYEIEKDVLKTFTSSYYGILCTVIDKKSSFLCYSTEEKVIRISYLAKLFSKKSENLDSTARCLALADNDSTLTAGLSNSSIIILEIPSLSILTRLEIHKKPVLNLKLSKNLIISYSEDKTLKLTNTQTELSTPIVPHSKLITSLAYTRDFKYFASGSKDRSIKLWSQSQNYYILTFTGHAAQVKSLTFLKSLKYLISSSTDKLLLVWKLPILISN